ncbi:bifunctional peptidase and arginyl-hydroxylase JMJD5 isoform X2 [Athalia rosae]|uniref:bifunctional peptidase and arginyl-hydroxylase JMJD5 isoform X2 n=1 Tax=Athalia rosae TaxID=37344 RepID=UPI002033C029|nr:bifunctional peptidase and arginyl-hydroxylase JMJD5 isoform X2 [Athalia rosae]
MQFGTPTRRHTQSVRCSLRRPKFDADQTSYYTSKWSTSDTGKNENFLLKAAYKVPMDLGKKLNFTPSCPEGPHRSQLIVMDISQLAKELLPGDTLLKDIESNSPPEIGIHLMSICKKLWTSINSNGLLLTDQWIQNALVKLDACLDRTWESLNSGYWKEVSVKYRYCYSFCTILKSALLLIRFDNFSICDKLKHIELDVLKEVILQIDKGILLGAPPSSIPGLLPNVARKLNSLILRVGGRECWNIQDQLLFSEDASKRELLPGFTPVPRCHQPSMEKFYTNIFQPKIPTILEGCMDHWRALNLWIDPEYLLQTAGVRTVPIEIGSRYTEENWTQRLVTLSEFLKSYLSSDKSSTPGYLAQYELFEQIPELMNDISIPDYCSFSDTQEEALPPNINAWLGPGGTISPLHFDPKNNLLCQVFGTKQIVLFHPDETPKLYPYETRLLSNTARVDPFNPDFDVWPRFKQAKGATCVLGPGEMLFIPPGWWHHVVALSPSFSVSFWWD